MLVNGDLKEVVQKHFKHEVDVLLTTIANELLHQVVAKRINDEFIQIGAELREDHLEVGPALLGAGHYMLVDFLLEKPATVLVFSQVQEFGSQLAERDLVDRE